MPIEIEAPDGSIVEFPDNTPRDTMRAAMAKRFPPSTASTQAVPQAPQATAQAPAPRTAAEQLGLGTRATVQGLLGLPGLVYDVAALPQNLLSNIPGLEGLRTKSAGQHVSEMTTAIGLPEPRNASERILSGAISGAAGVPTGFGMGGAVRQAAGPTAERLANMLMASPAQQAISGATGGVGAQAMQELVEEDASPAAKMALGVVGGAAGAVAPGAAVSAGRRIVTPLPSRLTGEEQRLAQIAQREGVTLPIGTATGSPTMQQIESSLEQLPASAGMAKAQRQQMREQFNAAAMKRAGETATDVSPATLDNAFSRLGQNFDDLAERTSVKLDNRFAVDIGSVARQYANRLPTDVRPVVVSRLEDLAKRIGTTMQGQEFQNISSDLRRATRENARVPEAQRALGEMANALDDAAERSMGPALAAEWRETRNQYRNLLAIDKAASQGLQADQAAGNLPFGALRQAVRAQDPRGFARGRGDLNEIARLGAFLADKVPDSGTSRRMNMANLLTLSGLGVAGGGMVSSIAPTAVAVGAGLATPYALQRAIQSEPVRSYLMNQRFAGPSPISPDARRAALINALTQGISP